MRVHTLNTANQGMEYKSSAFFENKQLLLIQIVLLDLQITLHVVFIVI